MKTSAVVGEKFPPEEKQLGLGAIQAQVSFLEGKVLTVIDASFTEDRQLKAVKDLIKRAFREQLDWITQLCYPTLPIQSREQVKLSGINVDEVENSTEVTGD